MFSRNAYMSILAVTTSLASQVSASEYCYQDLKGKVEGNRYYTDAFIIDIQDMSCQTTIYDDWVGSQYYVVFQGEMGDLLRYEVDTSGKTHPDMVVHVAANLEKIYPVMAQDCVIGPISKLFPGTRVSMNELLDFGNGQNGCFFMLEIPGGSTLIDVDAGKRLDSVRGYLCFLNGYQIVFISSQIGDPAEACWKRTLSDKEIKAKRREVLMENLLLGRKHYHNLDEELHPEKSLRK